MEFDSIYKTYFKDVYLYTYSLSFDEHIAEEISQETFIKALKNIDSFDGSKDIRAWLFTIAKNTYFTLYKKRNNLISDDSIPANTVDTSTHILEQISDEETAFKIHQFIHNMPEPYKEVFTLRVFGELKFEKIGMLFGKSSNWARVTYYRAKNIITEYMEENENG